MAFRSEVDNGARLVRFQKPPHQIAFANVALNKRVSGSAATLSRFCKFPA